MGLTAQKIEGLESGQHKPSSLSAIARLVGALNGRLEIEVDDWRGSRVFELTVKPGDDIKEFQLRLGEAFKAWRVMTGMTRNECEKKTGFSNINLKENGKTPLFLYQLLGYVKAFYGTVTFRVTNASGQTVVEFSTPKPPLPSAPLIPILPPPPQRVLTDSYFVALKDFNIAARTALRDMRIRCGVSQSAVAHFINSDHDTICRSDNWVARAFSFGFFHDYVKAVEGSAVFLFNNKHQEPVALLSIGRPVEQAAKEYGRCGPRSNVLYFTERVFKESNRHAGNNT